MGGFFDRLCLKYKERSLIICSLVRFTLEQASQQRTA